MQLSHIDNATAVFLEFINFIFIFGFLVYLIFDIALEFFRGLFLVDDEE